MNFELIGLLVRLRYRLLWARTRTRNGRIALFFVGYITLILLLAFLSLGGVGAGVAAVRAGKAEQIAHGLLSALFLSAFVTSLALGFGLNSAFSDLQLRRYPLRGIERRVARYFTGMLDPFWLLYAAMELGLAFGLYLLGVGSLPLGILAALLLYACNYLASQTAATAFDRVGQMRGGAIILSFGLLIFAVLPGLAAPWFIRNPAARGLAMRVLSVTPGFAAGSLMTRTDAAALYGFALIALWTGALAAALVALERWQPKSGAGAAGPVRWDSIPGRVGALCGPAFAPLVTCWLEFYFRCKRFRIAYSMGPVLVAILLFTSGASRHAAPPLARTAGVFAMMGFAPAAAFICNQFGYAGGGFRRFFLFPADPGRALRAGSYVLAALCAAMLIPAVAIWTAVAPEGGSWRSGAMMLLYGLTGLFGFHAAGLWTTLYGARRSDPNKSMGNDLSLAANVVLIGAVITLLIGPQLLARSSRWGALMTPDHLEIPALAACAAAAFYFFSLRSAERLVSGRRERLLAIVDGRA